MTLSNSRAARILGAIAAASFVVIPGAAQNAAPCEALPEVRQAIDRTPNVDDYGTALEDRLKPLRALLEKYPGDVFAQRRYQDRFRSNTYLHEEFDRALATYRSKPDDPVFRYLEARLTASFDAARAEAMYGESIAREPAFPWPHLGIAELTDRPGTRDAKKAELHLRAFLAACPGSIEGYGMLRTVEDQEMLRDGAAKLRRLLEARRDLYSLPYWSGLWDLELRSAPKDGEETVRRRILEDAEALKKAPPVLSMEWYRPLLHAVELTKDEGLSRWLEETVLARFPRSTLAANVERARWARKHPRPGRGAKAEEIETFAALEKARKEELAQRFSGEANVILDAWQAVNSGNGARPPEERLAIVDAMSAMRRQSPDAPGPSVPPLAILVADLYTRWGVRLDQVPGLIQIGLQASEQEARYAPVPGMFPEEVRNRRMDPAGLTHWRGLLVMADLYLKQKKPDRAREAIQAGLANVERRPVFALDSEQGKRDVQVRRGYWLVREARLAELEGDAANALRFYQEYTQSQGRKALENAQNFLLEIRELIADAKRAYLASGGKEESWLDWAAAPAPATPEVKAAGLSYSALLPDFQAKDLNGRTWSLADFKGRATLIDVWATWCGPCRAEHPLLQEFYARIKDRKDIQVLTFSMDDTAYLPAAYMKEQKYGFPVIASKDLGEKLFPVLGLPQRWIVDAQGRRSAPLLFHPGDFERFISELEKAAGAK